MSTKRLPPGITQRGSKFRVSVMVSGRRRTATVSSLKEAVEKAEEFRVVIPEQVERDVSHLWSIEEGFERYIEDHLTAGGYAASSIKNYHARQTVLCDFFGTSTCLSDITSADLHSFMGDTSGRYGKRTPNTIKAYMQSLLAVMGYAQRRGAFAGELPAPPKFKSRSKTVRYLTYDQEDQILAYFEHFGDADMVDLVSVLIDTGMRVEVECLALEWENVDLKNSRIFIWESKSHKPRTIPMTNRVKTILKKRKLSGAVPKGPFRCFSVGTARNRWDEMRDCVSPLSGREFSFHICRHTFCTRLVSAGVDLRSVQELAGHAKIQTTMIYSHFIPSKLFSAVEKLENLRETERVSTPAFGVVKGGAN